MSAERDSDRPEPGDVPLVVRSSAGANCSSVGSVVDLLFATAAVSTAVFAAAWAALAREARPEDQDDATQRDNNAPAG